jgi:hypothetical protein
VVPPPPLQLPRTVAGVGDTFPCPTPNPDRSESAILNALREERQSLIDKQRNIDASLEMIRSGRLVLPTAGPRREVSLDFGVANSLQRQAAAARREEEIRGLARFTASLGQTGSNNKNSYDSHQHQDSAHVLANLRLNRDDLLEEGSEQSGRHLDDVTLAAAYRQQGSYPSRKPPGGGSTDFSQQELLAHLRSTQAQLANAQLANRELFLSGSRLGGLDQPSSSSTTTLPGQDRLLQFQDNHHQLLEDRLALEARMPDTLARSRTLDPSLLLRRSGLGGIGNGGGHRMF